MTVLLGDRGEDAEACTELLNGPSSLKPAVSFLLLGFKELITQMFPLLRGERTQNPGGKDTPEKHLTISA